MRIIRLISQSENIFENDFSDEILVQPNGQMALLNTSLKMNPHEIIIDSSNDIVTYQLAASDGTRSLRLSHDAYKQEELGALETDMTLQLNNSIGYLLEPLNYTPPNSKDGGLGIEVGMQWKVESTKNKISIGFKNANRKMRVADFKAVNVTNTTSGIFVAKHSKGADTTKIGYQYSGVPISEGSAQMMMKATRFSKPTTGAATDGEIGCVVGFTTKDFTKGGVPTIADVKYGVQVFQAHGDTLGMVASVIDGVADYAAARAGLVANGITSAHYYHYAGDTSTQNTTFGVSINLGALDFLTYTTADAGVSTSERVISTIDLSNSDRVLYPIILYFSDDVGGIGGLLGEVVLGRGNASNNFVTLNPYELNLPETVDTDLPGNFEVDHPRPPPQVFRRTQNRLELQSGLATFLGFAPRFSPGPSAVETVLNTTATSAGGVSYTYLNYIGNSTFKGATLNDNYVIEILSLDLDSYDGLTTERKSILATIPKAEDGTGNLIYEANNINKVSLRNASAIGLRGMRCRVLTSDLSPVPIDGFSVITIGLYDSEKP